MHSTVLQSSQYILMPASHNSDGLSCAVRKPSSLRPPGLTFVTFASGLHRAARFCRSLNFVNRSARNWLSCCRRKKWPPGKSSTTACRDVSSRHASSATGFTSSSWPPNAKMSISRGATFFFRKLLHAAKSAAATSIVRRNNSGCSKSSLGVPPRLRSSAIIASSLSKLDKRSSSRCVGAEQQATNMARGRLQPRLANS